MKLLGATNYLENEETRDYQTALEAMEDLQIFKITKGTNGLFDIAEACDKWFGVMMTPAQLRQLGEEIIALSGNVTQEDKDKAQAEKLIASACSLDSKSWDNLFKTVLESSTPALVKALEAMVILNSEYPIENLKAAIFSARREGLDSKTVKSYEMDVWRAEQKLIAVEAVQNEEPEPDEEEIQDAKDALGKAYGILKGGVK